MMNHWRENHRAHAQAGRMARVGPGGVVVVVAVVAACASTALAQTGGAAAPPTPAAESHSLLEFVKAGGVVGYVIILLSVVAVAVVIDTLMRMKRERLLPPHLVSHSMELAEAGRFGELATINKASDSLFGRIVGGGLEHARLGIDAVRQEMQQLGEAEVLKLRNRLGVIGVIATAGPMLGLLGTVIGMIGSFQVLGAAKNAARADELAVGISTALVTTCQGLLLAVPLVFAHAFLRDRIGRVAQELGHNAERLLTLIAAADARNKQQAPQRVAAAQPPPPQPAMPAQVVAPPPGFPARPREEAQATGLPGLTGLGRG